MITVIDEKFATKNNKFDKLKWITNHLEHKITHNYTRLFVWYFGLRSKVNTFEKKTEQTPFYRTIKDSFKRKQKFDTIEKQLENSLEQFDI